MIQCALRNFEESSETPLDVEHQCEVLSYQYNTNNLVLLLTWHEQQVVAKITSSSGHSGKRLRQEIDWYRRILAERQDILRHCPRYIDSFTLGGNLVLILEYIPDAFGLRHALLGGRLLPYEAIEIVGSIIAALGHRIGRYGEWEQHCLAAGIYGRIHTRSMNLRRLLASSRTATDYWSRPISVNGLAPVSLSDIAKWLYHIASYLMHTEVGVLGETHGDLHLENIILQGDDGSRFFLVDPNGGIGPIPIYDLGKLAHSVDGLYDLILSRNVSISCPHPLEVYLDFAEEPHRLYQELNLQFTDLLRGMTGDEEKFMTLRTQVRLMCLVHFLCLLPHHYQDRYRFLALLARTVELFHEARAVMAQAPR